MTMRYRIVAIAVALLAAAGCREDDGFVGAPGGARAYVTSDPAGGRILVDGRNTGRFTPDTIRGLSGRHDITVRLDTLSTSYRYTAQVILADPDSTAHVAGPLVLRCATNACFRELFRHYSVNRVRFATNPVGTLFHAGGNADGLIWPASTNNSYASAAIPMFSGIMGGDTVALGMYDIEYLAGRPVPEVTQDGDHVRIRKSAWILPPSNLLQAGTVRGIQIDQEILSLSAVEDVVVVRLVFRNITHEFLYRLVDPFLAPEGVTFHSAYVGFALDADIGTSTDDMLSYDADLDMAFIYDARFEEGSFGADNVRPGMVGLRMLEAPPSTNILMNGWSRQVPGASDWTAGSSTERFGWGMMSGTRVYAPAHAHPRIGHLPTAPGDVRIMVTAGPLGLAPGDSAAVTVAVVIASPAPGTFTSGLLAEPGNPLDKGRSLYRTAAPLFERARAAEVVTTLAPGSSRFPF